MSWRASDDFISFAEARRRSVGEHGPARLPGEYRRSVVGESYPPVSSRRDRHPRLARELDRIALLLVLAGAYVIFGILVAFIVMLTRVVF